MAAESKPRGRAAAPRRRPIGLVYYYAEHRELRLGQPFTITKKNVDRYAYKF